MLGTHDTTDPFRDVRVHLESLDDALEAGNNPLQGIRNVARYLLPVAGFAAIASGAFLHDSVGTQAHADQVSIHADSGDHSVGAWTSAGGPPGLDALVGMPYGLSIGIKAMAPQMIQNKAFADALMLGFDSMGMTLNGEIRNGAYLPGAVDFVNALTRGNHLDADGLYPLSDGAHRRLVEPAGKTYMLIGFEVGQTLLGVTPITVHYTVDGQDQEYTLGPVPQSSVVVVGNGYQSGPVGRLMRISIDGTRAAMSNMDLLEIHRDPFSVTANTLESAAKVMEGRTRCKGEEVHRDELGIYRHAAEVMHNGADVLRDYQATVERGRGVIVKERFTPESIAWMNAAAQYAVGLTWEGMTARSTAASGTRGAEAFYRGNLGAIQALTGKDGPLETLFTERPYLVDYNGRQVSPGYFLNDQSFTQVVEVSGNTAPVTVSVSGAANQDNSGQKVTVNKADRPNPLQMLLSVVLGYLLGGGGGAGHAIMGGNAPGFDNDTPVPY
jgi:hypothetical protein